MPQLDTSSWQKNVETSASAVLVQAELVATKKASVVVKRIK